MRRELAVRTDEMDRKRAQEEELDRLSRDLKRQVELAKARISDRYGKLVERRSFDPDREDSGG
jgi:hypothetical protein